MKDKKALDVLSVISSLSVYVSIYNGFNIEYIIIIKLMQEIKQLEDKNKKQIANINYLWDELLELQSTYVTLWSDIETKK